jgi:hypothetical protein
VANYQPARTGPGLARPVIAGSAAAAAGAAVWAAAAYVTSDQFEFIAVLLGVGVGAAVTRAGGGPLRRLQAVGALLAVAGCALGTLIAMIAVLAGRYAISLGVIFGHLGIVLRAYPGSVGWMGILFWVAAAAAAAWYPARGLAGPAGGRARRRPAASGRPGRGQTAPWPALPDAQPGGTAAPAWAEVRPSAAETGDGSWRAGPGY